MPHEHAAVRKVYGAAVRLIQHLDARHGKPVLEPGSVQDLVVLRHQVSLYNRSRDIVAAALPASAKEISLSMQTAPAGDNALPSKLGG